MLMFSLELLCSLTASTHSLSASFRNLAEEVALDPLEVVTSGEFEVRDNTVKLNHDALYRGNVGTGVLPIVILGLRRISVQLIIRHVRSGLVTNRPNNGGLCFYAKGCY